MCYVVCACVHVYVYAQVCDVFYSLQVHVCSSVIAIIHSQICLDKFAHKEDQLTRPF